MRSALIIANTEYTDPGLAQLTAPGRDAEDFARVLKDQDICAFDDVNILLNQPEHIVRGTIDEFFDQKKPDDLLILYFSGHGVRDELGSLYLAVKNTIRTRLRSTAIKSDYIREAMDQSRSKRQVLILDCCNSGAFSQGTKAATGVSIGTASAFEAGYGRIILTASDSTQFAWEGNQVIGETDNSLFTHYLVEGLEGEADLDGDGSITVDELYDYAYDKVKRATPKQTPSKFSSKQQGEILLRQITRIEDIKPASLPEELAEATEDSRTFVRESAVQQLEKLLKGKNLGLARSAREALERMEKEDDSFRVREATTHILEPIRQAEKAEEERRAREEAERLLAEEQKAREEAERIAAQKAEMKRLARQKAEAEQKAEEERKAREDAECIAAQKAEEERLAREKAEAERKAKEEAERLLAERKAEEEHKAKEETDRIAMLKAEEERIALEKAETERKAKEEAERLLAEQKAEEQKAREEAERIAAQKAEKKRLAREKVEAERRAREEVERLAARKAEEDHKAGLEAMPIEIKAVPVSVAPVQGKPLSKRMRYGIVAVVVLVIARIALSALFNGGEGGSATITEQPSVSNPVTEVSVNQPTNEPVHVQTPTKLSKTQTTEPTTQVPTQTPVVSTLATGPIALNESELGKLYGSTKDLKSLAKEKYGDQYTSMLNSGATFEVENPTLEPLLLSTSFCSSRFWFASDLPFVEVNFEFNGQRVTDNHIGYINFQNSESDVCGTYFMIIDNWSSGRYSVQGRMSASKYIVFSDGQTATGLLNEIKFVVLIP